MTTAELLALVQAGTAVRGHGPQVRVLRRPKVRDLAIEALDEALRQRAWEQPEPPLAAQDGSP